MKTFISGAVLGISILLLSAAGDEVTLAGKEYNNCDVTVGPTNLFNAFRLQYHPVSGQKELQVEIESPLDVMIEHSGFGPGEAFDLNKDTPYLLTLQGYKTAALEGAMEAADGSGILFQNAKCDWTGKYRKKSLNPMITVTPETESSAVVHIEVFGQSVCFRVSSKIPGQRLDTVPFAVGPAVEPGGNHAMSLYYEVDGNSLVFAIENAKTGFAIGHPTVLTEQKFAVVPKSTSGYTLKLNYAAEMVSIEANDGTTPPFEPFALRRAGQYDNALADPPLVRVKLLRTKRTTKRSDVIGLVISWRGTTTVFELTDLV